MESLAQVDPGALFPQQHTPNWFETYTGRRIIPVDPYANVIVVADIAHALSHCCRFAGHCREFYSVATHSMLVFYLVASHTDDLNTLKYALMHDATEAYIHDITRPLKVSELMGRYKLLEDHWARHIANELGIDLSAVDHQLVKEADNHALKIEAARLMPSGGAEWGLPATRTFADIMVHFTTPAAARDAFVAQWEALNG